MSHNLAYHSVPDGTPNPASLSIDLAGDVVEVTIQPALGTKQSVTTVTHRMSIADFNSLVTTVPLP